MEYSKYSIYSSVNEFSLLQNEILYDFETFHSGAQKINNIIKKYLKLHRIRSHRICYYRGCYIWYVHFKNGTYITINFVPSSWATCRNNPLIVQNAGLFINEKAFSSFKEFDDELHDLSLILRPKNSRK